MSVGLSWAYPPESEPNCLGITQMRHLGVLYQVEGIVAAADVEHPRK